MKARFMKLIEEASATQMQEWEDPVAEAALKAIQTRQYDKAEQLLRLFQLDVNKPIGVHGLKLLDQASRYCQDEQGIRMMGLLLEKGALIDGKDMAGWTALMAAARCSNTSSSLDAIKYLVERGATLDLQNNRGWTALMHAVRNSNKDSSLETVQYLVDRGASLDIQNKDGWTALMFASHCSNEDSSFKTVTCLVERGASLNLRENNGMTALMHAVRNSNNGSSLEIVKYLAERGAFLDLQENTGWTALMMAARYSNKDSSLETVQYLLEQGASLDLREKNGWTALMMASRYSNGDSSLKTVMCLVKQGASLDLQNNNGLTALMLAAYNSNKDSSQETVELLVEAGTNLNIRGENRAALEHAANNVGGDSHLITVVYLVECGALFDCTQYMGTDAATTAYLKRYPAHHLKAVASKLKDDLTHLTIGKERARALLWKTDLERGRELPLDNLLALPYHRVQDGIGEFLRRAGEQGFYNMEAIRGEVERAQKGLTETLDALSRVAHTSEVVREVVFASWEEARKGGGEPPMKRTRGK